MFRRVRLLGTCAGCTLALASASAQIAGDAVGAIDGTIRDASGGVLPRVVVRVAGSALMGAREALSRDDGFYRIQALAPGDYEITFTLDGFSEAVRRDVRVRPGATTTVSIVLDLDTFRDDITVGRDAPAVDRRATSLAAVMDAQELADLPGSRTVGAIFAAAPSIQLTGFDVGGSSGFMARPFSAHGFTGYNRPMLEGVDISQHQRFNFALDYGSFDQAWIGLGAFGSQMPSPGVSLQVIAKSGGDRYRGALYTGYQNSRWQAHNIDADQTARGAADGQGLSAREANRLHSYQDLNADIGGFFVRGHWWWYASIRDHRVAARTVSFPVTPLETSASAVSLKTTIRTSSTGTLVLFAYPGITRQPMNLSSFLRQEAVNLSEESTSNRETRGLVWKSEWTAALGAALLANVRIGQFVVNRTDSPRGELPRFEDLVTLTAVGGNRTWREDLHKTQLTGSLSYLHEGRGGRHQLKAGGDIVRAVAAETWYRGFAGDVVHVLRGGTPAEVYLLETPSQSRSGQWWYSAFVNDSWYAHDRLTITGGLRYDRFRAFLPEQQHPAGRFNLTSRTFEAVNQVAAWNAVAPRMGASVDPVGDGQTFIKGSYNLYWLPPGTDLGFNANPNAPVWWQRYVWSDSNLDLLWQPGEESSPPLERRGGTTLESLDPNLTLAYVREASAHLDRQVGSFTVSSGMVWRAERQQGLRQFSDRSFEMFTVSRILADPGPADTTLVTAPGDRQIQVYDLPGVPLTSTPVVGNVSRSNSDYTTWEIAATRRLEDRWSLAASLAHTWNRDQASGYGGQSVRANQYSLTPNDLINTDGEGRHVFRTWTARTQATWLAPWGLRVTSLVRHQSGQPFGRTILARLNYGTIRVLAEPIGTRRQDNVTLVDLGVQKDIALGGGRRVSAFVQAFNLFNANPEQNISWASGPSFLRPLTIVPPRIARVGIQVNW